MRQTEMLEGLEEHLVTVAGHCARVGCGHEIEDHSTPEAAPGCEHPYCECTAYVEPEVTLLEVLGALADLGMVGAREHFEAEVAAQRVAEVTAAAREKMKALPRHERRRLEALRRKG